MTALGKLLIFLCFLGMVVAVPIISAGITFGAPIYRQPIYYDHQPYYPHYHEVPTRYSYGYSNGYEYYGGGGGGLIGGSISYSPFLL